MLASDRGEAMVTPEENPSSTRARLVPLALISLAAAGLHFAVMGDHFQESVAIGSFFAVVAWAQALWAVALIAAPSRTLLLAGLAGNLAVIATWVVSRTVGIPIGPEPWAAEPVGFADLVSTLLELAIVAGCAVLLVRRGEPAEHRRWRSIAALALGLSLVALTSVAIAAGDRHAHDGSEANDHGTSDEAHVAGVQAHLLAGGSGEPDLAQIALIRSAMRRYRDVHMALAEGWRKEHQDWPEIGAHFYRAGDWADSFPAEPSMDLLHPEYLMYSKFLTGEWKLVAVAYVVDQALYPDPPTDLTGAIYHEHVWNCIADGDELEEEDWGVISPEECDIMGGVWSPGGVWMTHVWLVDNPNGIFAETNPTLTSLRIS